MKSDDAAKPWERKNPAKKHTKLQPKYKAQAKAAAKKAGRRYPNMVDNMHAAQRQKAEQGDRSDQPKKAA